jgi:hypothetical protein
LSLIGNISSNASPADLEMSVLLLFLDEGMDCALKLWQASFTELLFIFFAEKNCVQSAAFLFILSQWCTKDLCSQSTNQPMVGCFAY